MQLHIWHVPTHAACLTLFRTTWVSPNMWIHHDTSIHGHFFVAWRCTCRTQLLPTPIVLERRLLQQVQKPRGTKVERVQVTTPVSKGCTSQRQPQITFKKSAQPLDTDFNQIALSHPSNVNPWPNILKKKSMTWPKSQQSTIVNQFVSEIWRKQNHITESDFQTMAAQGFDPAMSSATDIDTRKPMVFDCYTAKKI